MKTVPLFSSRLLALGTLFSLGTALSAAVLSFDPVVNPHASLLGTQSYGYAAVLGGTFVQDTVTGGSGGSQTWSSAGNPAGLVGFNSNSVALLQMPVVFDPLALTLKPGAAGEYAVIRQDTSLASVGVYTVTGSFWGQVLTSTTSDVHILKNGAEIFGGTVNGFGPSSSVSFSLNVTLSAGDTLDFAVGNGGSASAFDHTGLTANITAASVPEPSGLPLLTLTGLLILTQRRRRALPV
jgi:hypothetical protein